MLVKKGIRFQTLDDFNKEYTENMLPNFTRYSAFGTCQEVFRCMLTSVVSRRYTAVTKLMNILTAKELQRRSSASSDPSSRIIVTSLNPGSVNTDGVQSYASRASVGPWLSPLYTLVAKLFFADPVKAAYVYIFAACAKEVRAEKTKDGAAFKWEGAYLQPPGRMGKASKQASQEELAKELWETTERFLGSIGIVLPPVEQDDVLGLVEAEST